MATYRIAVLGAGKIGGTLGKKWATAGHAVAFGVRDTESMHARALQAELGQFVSIGTLAQALVGAEVVLFALPGEMMEEVIARYAAQLEGKILMDAANNLSGGPVNSLTAFRAHTPHASVYRAFNSYGWENFAETLYAGVQADLFYSGPAGETGAVVEQLISEIGLRPVRVGDTDQADLIDGLLLVWFALSPRQGTRHLTLKLLTR